MNVVIYARFSSHNQQEQSIDGQLRVCKEYCKRMNYNIVNTYIDRAMTGTNDNRPAFQQMIADSYSKQFCCVIVYKLDRFARNRYDSAINKHKLKENGVKVVSATEPIGDGSESILLEALLEAMAEQYSKQLAQNIRRGIHESALKANALGGTPPLGYKFKNKKFVVDEESADIVRFIYTEYASGTSKKEIATKLNERGIKTQYGNKFTSSSFNRILCNPRHIGTYIVKDVVIEDAIPPIISKELYNKCLERAEKNKKLVNNKTEVEYLLTGKLFCGYCGCMLTGEKCRGKLGKEYYYYSCKNMKKHRCKKKREKKDFIEWYICEQAVEYISNSKRREYIAENVCQEFNKRFSNTEIKEMEKYIRKLDKELEDATDSLIQAKSSRVIEKINKRIEETEEKLDFYENELAKLRIYNGAKLVSKDIIEWLKKFANGDLFDYQFRKYVVDILINAVYLFDDKVVIYFNTKDGKQVSHIEMCEDIKSFDDGEGFECQTLCSTKELCSRTQKNAVIFFRDSLFALLMKRTE